MTKAKKIVLITLTSIVAVLGIFLLVWYFGDSYTSFYNRATKEFEIAGLSEGFTPQGLCYESESKTFLSCGYMKNGSASRIYVTKDGKTEKYFTLTDGENAYTGHSGGIATNGTNVWIVGDGTVYRFSFADIDSVENGGTITILDSFKSANGADFVTVVGDNLWIGEFHREGKYDTDTTHQIETADGTTNKALSLLYYIDNTKDCGVQSTTPVAALSTMSLVQGMAITENNIVLSTSYSLANSHLYVYNNVLKMECTNTFNLDGTEIPLYILDSTNLVETITAPCMSEEIAYADGRVYIMFESASAKYRLFTREPLKNVYSIEI